MHSDPNGGRQNDKGGHRDVPEQGRQRDEGCTRRDEPPTDRLRQGLGAQDGDAMDDEGDDARALPEIGCVCSSGESK